MPMPSHTLIIGYGSPIRGDDAIGLIAVERLVERGLAADVTALARHVLTAELVTELECCQRVIFLDAAAIGEPGAIAVRRIAPDVTAHSTLAHVLDPAELLAWCQRLFGHAPEAYLITVTGACFDYAHCQLSPIAAAALEHLIVQVENWLLPNWLLSESASILANSDSAD